MKTKILSLMTVVVLSMTLNAGVVDHDKMFNAYLKGDLATWKKELSSYVANPSLTFQDKCDVANYLYGYIGFILDSGAKKAELEKWMTYLDSYIEEMMKHKSTKSMAHLYKAGSYAFKAKTYKKIVSYGIKSVGELDEALEEDPNNAIAIGLKGNVKFYAPAIVGGNKKKALEFYVKAVNILSKKCPQTYQWNYWALKLCIVEAYVGLGEKDKAEAYYKQVMKAKPDFLLLKKSYESGNFGNHETSE
ncbi:MAG: hypothetical protein MJZ95_04125 [Paludibacteraceae bacterium]|nr:hypothetical protein [Paludibacteraceae bacterium]